MSLFFAALTLIGTLAHASDDVQDICPLQLSGKAVNQAIARGQIQREALRAEVKADVAKLGVYVPVGTLNKIRRLLVDIGLLRPSFRRTDDASERDFERMNDEILIIMTGVINHPRNLALFGPAAYELSLNSSNIFRYLMNASNLPLETRVALMAYVSAYQHSRMADVKTYGTMMDADVAFARYQDADRQQHGLLAAQKGKFAGATVRELKNLEQKLIAQKEAIRDRRLTGIELPQAINEVIEKMVSEASPNTPIYSYHDAVNEVQDGLNKGVARDEEWRLTNLWSEGSGILTLGSPKDVIRSRLRELVIGDNLARVLSSEVVERIRGVDSDLDQIGRILGPLRN